MYQHLLTPNFCSPVAFSSVIRTAPFFTNVKALWSSHLKLHENSDESRAYAHVEATMARLPFACALGKESLLQSLVESNVPVKVGVWPANEGGLLHQAAG